jgi:hypothetical protein
MTLDLLKLLKRVNRVDEVLYIVELAKGGVGMYIYLYICIFMKAIHKITYGELLTKQAMRKSIQKYKHA